MARCVLCDHSSWLKRSFVSSQWDCLSKTGVKLSPVLRSEEFPRSANNCVSVLWLMILCGASLTVMVTGAVIGQVFESERNDQKSSVTGGGVWFEDAAGL